MKIITWNCNMAFRKKAGFILTQQPDILIVPECEHPDKLLFNADTKKPTDTLWFGTNRNKGLGIFSYSDFRFEVLDEHNQDLQMIIPVSVTGVSFDFILFLISQASLCPVFVRWPVGLAVLRSDKYFEKLKVRCHEFGHLFRPCWCSSPARSQLTAVVGVRAVAKAALAITNNQHRVLKNKYVRACNSKKRNMANIITEYLQFFTATNLEWKKLLKPDKYKDIVIDSLRFLVKENRIILYAFVTMENHLHLIWQMAPGIKPDDVQRDFLKYTAQKIKKDLQINHPKVLSQFKVKTKDRQYQFWERNGLSIELRTGKVFQQKINYIHNNPVTAGLCTLPEQYRYSSASLYELNKTEWDFLTYEKD